MKVLLEEAQRMIKSLEGSEVRENKASTTGRKEASFEDLQKQLEALKKVSLRQMLHYQGLVRQRCNSCSASSKERRES